LELKNIKNEMFKNFKKTKITTKHPIYNFFLKIMKSYQEAPNEKKFRKQNMVIIEKY